MIIYKTLLELINDLLLLENLDDLWYHRMVCEDFQLHLLL